MHSAFNLSDLQTMLKAYPEYADIAKQIGRYMAARSFQQDLLAAQSALATLLEVSADPTARNLYGQALMTHAIIMYCRAAIEDGNGRFKMGVTKGYSQAQLKKHQNIVKLRNKSIAHFDIGVGDYGKEWIQEHAVLRIVDSQPFLGDVWSRSNFIARLVFDMDELSGVALETVTAAVNERKSRLAAVLFKALAFDRKLWSLLQKCPFDPQPFFDGAELATDFWKGPGGDYEHFTPKAILDDDTILVVGPVVTTKR
jgi:hypothetical protein